MCVNTNTRRFLSKVKTDAALYLNSVLAFLFDKKHGHNSTYLHNNCTDIFVVVLERQHGNQSLSHCWFVYCYFARPETEGLIKSIAL